MVRIVGVDTGCSMAGLPIILCPFHIYQGLIAERQSLSKHSCHKTRFMLLFTHSYTVHLIARTYCSSCTGAMTFRVVDARNRKIGNPTVML